MKRSRLRSTFPLLPLVCGLVLPFAAVGPPEAAADEPAVVTARVLEPDPAAAEGEARYLVEVGEVRHGSVPGSVLVVGIDEDDGVGRRLAAGALARGEPLEQSLVPEPAGGGWRAAAVRAVGDDEVADPTPSPLAAEAVKPPPGADRPPPRFEAATAGAPFEHQVLEIVNEERLADGNLPPLKGVGLLDTSSETHSSNMATRDFFAHCDVDTKTSHGDRMTAAGYFWHAAGENIAAGQTTPQSVMDTWMGSPDHRAIILSTGWRELGVGHVLQSNDQATVRFDQDGDCDADLFGLGPYFRYWTQNFGRRNSVYPVVVEREDYQTACAEVDLYTYGLGWAQEMRFSNDGATWSAWMPFSPDVDWSLDLGESGSATVFSELRSGATVRAASDSILLTAAYPAPSDVQIYGQTLTGTATYTACDTLRAGNGTEVATNADVTFEAPTVVLVDGFTVADGASFTAGSP